MYTTSHFEKIKFQLKWLVCLKLDDVVHGDCCGDGNDNHVCDGNVLGDDDGYLDARHYEHIDSHRNFVHDDNLVHYRNRADHYQ